MVPSHSLLRRLNAGPLEDVVTTHHALPRHMRTAYPRRSQPPSRSLCNLPGAPDCLDAPRYQRVSLRAGETDPRADSLAPSLTGGLRQRQYLWHEVTTPHRSLTDRVRPSLMATLSSSSLKRGMPAYTLILLGASWLPPHHRHGRDTVEGRAFDHPRTIRQIHQRPVCQIDQTHDPRFFEDE